MRPRLASLCLVLVTVAGLAGAAGVAWAARTRTARPAVARQAAAHRARRAVVAPAAASASRELGQLVVSAYDGPTPTPGFLAAIRAGQIGSVILFGSNTSGGAARTRAAVAELQRAAHAGHNPGLLVMTDQEGGEVNRLPGAPTLPASAMSNPRVAAAQGARTARLLRSAGVNVDLAPVADVARTDGFIAAEHRSFGSRPATVAAAACAFAGALSRGGVGYTLKHFPGLGDAVQSTDDQPVSISESRADIEADGAAYRRCGRGPRTLVMLSSASYTHLTGATPAVLSPFVYHRVLPADHVNAVTISDAFATPAIDAQSHPALRALSAGLDMLLYSEGQSVAAPDEAILERDLRAGSLSAARVRQAAGRVLALKRALGVG